MNITTLIARTADTTRRVALCSDKAIELGGQVFRPDRSTAYVEMYLSHAFPVTTIDKTGLHPQVVANSYRSMLYKVFDLAHIMKKYDPRNNPRDRILGTIVGVEFPETPAGGWKVQADRSQAPGIRAVACMHRNAEQVDQILATHFSGEMNWTVSMEQNYDLENSGFLVKAQVEEWEEKTPEDLRALGWTFIPVAQSPDSLLKCFDSEESKINRDWNGEETIMLIGGLNGMIHYQGVGLTPVGKEKEAEVSLMLAGRKMIEVDGVLVPDVVGLLSDTAKLP